MSDKNKAIITVGLSIVVLAGIFLYHGITRYNALVQQSIAQEEKRFHAHILDLEKYAFGPYTSRIGNILRLKSKMVAAFASRNRETLYIATLPLYEALKRENPYFEVMHFHLPDGTTFLRMHNPEFFGDNLKDVRPIVEAVNRSKTQHSGFEIGRHGPYYRIVQPVFFEDNYIGILEFGIKTHQLLEAAQSNLSGNSTAYFLETEWQKVDHEGKHFKMLPFGKFVLNSHNDPFYMNLPSKIDLNKQFIHIKMDDKIYVLHSQPVFRNYRQEVLGGIVIPQDITYLIQERNKFIIQMCALVLLLTILSLSVLYMSFNKLVRSLEKSKIKLKDSVDALTTEVKEREKAEDKALQAQNEWEKTFDVMDDMVTIQDRDMYIVRANKAAEDFFEVGPGELDGKKCYEVFRGSLEPCPRCPGLDTLQDIQNHSEIIEHKELKKIFQVSSAPLLNKNNDVRYLVHVARDITEQKKLEEDLFQAHKMEAIGTLAGGIAHDFNNILSSIIGFAELAKLNIPGDSEAVKDIDVVLESSRRAADLVTQILTFSRKSDHQVQSIMPHLIVKESLKMLRSSLPTTVTLNEKIDIECGSIQADPTNIHQIVVNLCTNAFHAMEHEKGSLVVKLRRKEIQAEDISENDVSPGSFIVLSVSDTGKGMDSETIERIFEPYFTTKDIGKGTGLGLAVIHGIVRDYKGFIEVESEPGKGSTFHIYFPALEKDTVIQEKIEEQALPTGTEHILVVDDESSIVKLHKTILQRLGYKVTAITNSEEAFEKFLLYPDTFDLLITDQTMPHLSGVELTQGILKINPSLPIILCTGYSTVITEEKALAIGIKKYVKKPVNRSTLAKIVRQVLDEN
jgi:PAS domain S-box-containing protein